MEFVLPLVAIDFETANSRRSSACSVGVVVFDRQRILHEWHTLLDPQDEFSQFNISIHGIRPDDVRGAPTIEEFARVIWPAFDGQTIVAHSGFDKSVVNAIAKQTGTRLPESGWLDSCDIARTVWQELPDHKLKTVCKKLNFMFKHHDALEDARACSHIVQNAMAALNCDERQLCNEFQ